MDELLASIKFILGPARWRELAETAATPMMSDDDVARLSKIYLEHQRSDTAQVSPEGKRITDKLMRAIASRQFTQREFKPGAHISYRDPYKRRTPPG
jgi:hypothetical protein